MLYDKSPKEVRLVEVAPRDGLQNESVQVPLGNKVAFVEALADAGLRHIEVSSFVRPERVPQLADAELLFQRIRRQPRVTYTAVAANLKGLERALSAGVNSIAVLTAASEKFNEKNLGCNLKESLDRLGDVVRQALVSGLRVRGYVSTAFVCPYEGKIRPERVAEIVERLQSLGVNNVSLGDTIGAAYPDAVSRLLDEIGKVRPLDGVALHLHDTCDRALANALVGLLYGISEFDASAGGLGGCPFAPGAQGNVATEKLIDFFQGQGIQVEGDRDKVKAALEKLPLKLQRKAKR